jgi:hypothetical protein
MKLRYFPCYHDEWLVGQAGLDNACRGLYLTACLLEYSHGGPVTIDELQRNCRDHGNAFNRQLDRLLKLGKLTRNGEEITNKRVRNELQKREKRSENGEENATKRWKSNGLSSEVALLGGNANQNQNQNQNHKPNGLSNKRPKGLSSLRGNDADLMAAIFIEECCPPLPPPRKLTAARTAQCHARLKELDGDLEQWRSLCLRVQASPFLTGDNERHWRADFDFVLKEASFNKILEGKFDPIPQGGLHGLPLSEEERQAGLAEARHQAGLREFVNG